MIDLIDMKVKKIVVEKLFDYKLINADYKEAHDIVSMIENFY